MYLDAIDDLTILRDHYKSEVRKKLEVKVQKQRKEREEKKALEKAQEKEKIEKVYTCNNLCSIDSFETKFVRLIISGHKALAGDVIIYDFPRMRKSVPKHSHWYPP